MTPDSISELSDAELHLACVQAMAHGDPQGLKRLYERHAAIVYGLALRITGDSATAAEATVATFVQAWNGAGRYRGIRGSVSGWLTTMARIRALELVRKAGSHVDVLSAGVSPLVVALPDETQKVLTLAYFGGLSHQEVADRLELPIVTVRRHLESGMRALRVKREVP